MSKGLHLIALDLDDCIRGPEIHPKALELIRNTYAEISPSGSGVRAFFIGYYPKLKKAADGLSIEVYSDKQFVTLTGQTGNLFCDLGNPQTIAPMPDEVRGFLDQFFETDSSMVQTTYEVDSLAGLVPRVGASFEDVREILTGIDPSCGRDTWLKVLQGVHHELGRSEEIIHLVNDWSAGRLTDGETPENYSGLKDVRSCIRSLGNKADVRPVTFASVIAIYQEQNEGLYPECLSSQDQPVLLAPASPDEWSEPFPLPDDLPPVQPYSSDLLPAILGDFVDDVSHRMQCPPDFVAVSLAVVLSSLIGARKVVCPKVRDPWQVTPNLWGGVVGLAGVKKSPAIAEVLKFLKPIDAKHSEDYASRLAEWDAKATLATIRGKKAQAVVLKEDYAGSDEEAAKYVMKAKEVPAKPLMRQTVVNDTTVEKLGEILETTPDGLLNYRDELYGLLCDLDKVGQESARTFYLSAFDGDKSYSVQRMSRSVNIDRLCFAILGSIQPSRLHEYITGATTGGAGDDGLMQRFSLMVWPDLSTDASYVDEAPDYAAAEGVRLVFVRLGALPARGANPPSIARFSSSAQALFEKWAGPFDKLLVNDELAPAMGSHLSKYRKLVPSLALIFSMVEKSVQDDVIELHHLEMAIRWVPYLRSHAERVYSASLRPELRAAKLLLSKIQKGQALDDDGRLSARHIERKGWSGLSDGPTVAAALKFLERYEFVRGVKVVPLTGVGGRPSVAYLVNPKLGFSKGGISHAVK
jgi:hypothetical protein